MPSCSVCDKKVISGAVLHSECLDGLYATNRQVLSERNSFKSTLEKISKYGGLAGHFANQALEGNILPVPYISVWDGGVEVESSAMVNIRTGEVTDVVTADVHGLDICEREYIVMNGEQVDVYQDERGYELWADIHNEI